MQVLSTCLRGMRTQEASSHTSSKNSRKMVPAAILGMGHRQSGTEPLDSGMRKLASHPAVHSCLCVGHTSPVTLSCSQFAACRHLSSHPGRSHSLHHAARRKRWWCVCCCANIPDRHKTLYIHINRAHSMKLLPRCPRICFYFCSRWLDVKKTHHHLYIDSVCSFGGCSRSLTPEDCRGGKPTCSGIHPEDCLIIP